MRTTREQCRKLIYKQRIHLFHAQSALFCVSSAFVPRLVLRLVPRLHFKNISVRMIQFPSFFPSPFSSQTHSHILFNKRTQPSTKMAKENPSQLVLVEKRGTTTIITINRPHKRNCVNGPTARALYQAFLDFDADSTVTNKRIMLLSL